MKLKAKQSEADFQKQIIELAKYRGWRVATFRKVRVQRKNGSVYYETPVGADGVGWPDLFLVRGKRVIAAELKVGNNKATVEQMQWLESLAATGVECHVWRPSWWNVIEDVLA